MKTKVKNLTPLKAIRAKCLDCCCDRKQEIQNCPCVDCSLYRYRLGKNPVLGNRLNTEQQQKMLIRMSEVRKRHS
jgi:hypothetical protein